MTITAAATVKCLPKIDNEQRGHVYDRFVRTMHKLSVAKKCAVFALFVGTLDQIRASTAMHKIKIYMYTCKDVGHTQAWSMTVLPAT